MDTKKKRPKSSKSTTSERSRSKTSIERISPYSTNYRPPIPHCQKHLIAMHLTVSKLSRSDLEDRYIQLCDENYQIKHENRDLKDKLKILTTRMMRVSSASLTIRKFKSVDMLSQGSSSRENHYDECDDNDGVKKKVKPRPTSQRVLKVRNDLDTEQFVDGVLNVLNGPRYDPKRPGNLKSQNKQTYLDRISELQQELDSKKEEFDDLKNKHFDLEVKYKELDAKMFEEAKKLVATNMEIKSLKRKAEKYELHAKHLKEEKRDLEKRLDATIEVERKKCDEVKELYEKEKLKSERSKEQNDELESNRKQILSLKEQIIHLESEKSSLKVHQENFTKLMEESAAHKATLDDLTHQNESLKKSIVYEKSEHQVLLHSQELLLAKLKALQDLNDSLSVEVEGLKSKLEYYTNENVSLELRLRDMENHKMELSSEIKQLREKLRERLEKENLKEKLLNKLSTVTFEPWESDVAVKSKSRTNSVSSQRSIKSCSSNNTGKKMNMKDSFSTTTANKANFKPPTPNKAKQLRRQKTSITSESKINETSLLERHCNDTEFYNDLNFIQQATNYAKADLTLDDITFTDEDMTPTRDSAHELSYQAEKAANLLLKDIKRSAGMKEKNGKVDKQV